VRSVRLQAATYSMGAKDVLSFAQKSFLTEDHI